MATGGLPGSMATVLAWLAFMEDIGAPATRARFGRTHQLVQARGSADRLLDHTVAAGLAVEDETALSLTDAGRQRLATLAGRA